MVGQIGEQPAGHVHLGHPQPDAVGVRGKGGEQHDASSGRELHHLAGRPAEVRRSGPAQLDGPQSGRQLGRQVHDQPVRGRSDGRHLGRQGTRRVDDDQVALVQEPRAARRRWRAPATRRPASRPASAPRRGVSPRASGGDEASSSGGSSKAVQATEPAIEGRRGEGHVRLPTLVGARSTTR